MGDAATVLPAGEGARAFAVGPDRASVKVEADQTGDAYSLFEYTAAPGGGPPPHVHRTVHEFFYVLEGEVEFRAGDEVVRATRGTSVFVPPGIVHTFRVVGGGPARWVGIFSPGRFMRLVEEIGKAMPAGGGPPDEAALVRAFAEWDMEIVEGP